MVQDLAVTMTGQGPTIAGTEDSWRPYPPIIRRNTSYVPLPLRCFWPRLVIESVDQIRLDVLVHLNMPLDNDCMFCLLRRAEETNVDVLYFCALVAPGPRGNALQPG